MESIVVRGPIQLLVFINILTVGAFVLCWVFSVYGLALRNNGSRRTWKKAVYVGLFAGVLGVGLLFVSQHAEPLNQKDQAAFDAQLNLGYIADKMTKTQHP